MLHFSYSKFPPKHCIMLTLFCIMLKIGFDSVLHNKERCLLVRNTISVEDDVFLFEIFGAYRCIHDGDQSLALNFTHAILYSN